MSRIITHEISVQVHILVTDDAPDDLFSRGQDTEWASALYGPMTEQEIVDHWSFNAVTNGILHIDHLDGWADVPAGSVDIEVTK